MSILTPRDPIAADRLHASPFVYASAAPTRRLDPGGYQSYEMPAYGEPGSSRWLDADPDPPAQPRGAFADADQASQRSHGPSVVPIDDRAPAGETPPTREQIFAEADRRLEAAERQGPFRPEIIGDDLDPDNVATEIIEANERPQGRWGSPDLEPTEEFPRVGPDDITEEVEYGRKPGSVSGDVDAPGPGPSRKPIARLAAAGKTATKVGSFSGIGAKISGIGKAGLLGAVVAGSAASIVVADAYVGDELRAGHAPGAPAGVLGVPSRFAGFLIGWGLKAEVAAIELANEVPDLTGVLMMPSPIAGQ